MKKKILLGIIALSGLSTMTACSNPGVTNDVLVIGMECNYQPFNWTTSKSSEYTLPIDKTNDLPMDTISRLLNI